MLYRMELRGTLRLAAVWLVIVYAPSGFCAGLSVTATHVDNEQRVDIFTGGQLFTAYKYADDQKYPYFFPVNGPETGLSVTTESSQPYPHHQSLFFACDHVNGGNYWQDDNRRGQILSQGPEIVEQSEDAVVLRDECLWKRPRLDPVIRDIRTVRISAPDEAVRLMDFTFALTALEDVHIRKTNHSLFSARMTPALSVEEGGAILNAEGSWNAEHTHGAASAWAVYFGERDSVEEGLAIMQHPDNEWYPAPFFTRDYGFFSPTPLNWLEDGYSIPKGETLTLRYRVVVFSGDPSAVDLPALFESYAGR